MPQPDRKNYVLTPEQARRFGGLTPTMDAWGEIGQELGFDPATVIVDPQRSGHFSAVPITEKAKEEEKSAAGGKFRLSFYGPSTNGKWKTDDVPLYHTKQEAIDAGVVRLTGDTGAGFEEFKVLEEVAAYGKCIRVEDLTLVQ